MSTPPRPITADASSSVRQTAKVLCGLDAKSPEYATDFVNALLHGARQNRASDVHLQPYVDALEIHWRIDGVLQPVGRYASDGATNPITRLKVLADLLTYHHDIPQEGRIRDGFDGVDIRISTFPTLHGERAVIRLFAEDKDHRFLDDLGYSSEVLNPIKQILSHTTGALLITGPAGSGKSTTAYACLRQIVQDSQGGRSVLTLEDPIEVAVPGVSQSQANPAAGFTLAAGLRSLLRQDPEVIFVGEVRDHETANLAIQASLTGQLVLSTFHAGSAAAAISRLTDMRIEPYMLRSGILGILAQRLVRKLCHCKQPISDNKQFLGLEVSSAAQAGGCDDCFGTGYLGRLPLAELLTINAHDFAAAILSRSDASALEKLAIANGMVQIRERALSAIESHQTSPAEVRRVLGFDSPIGDGSTPQKSMSKP